LISNIERNYMFRRRCGIDDTMPPQKIVGGMVNGLKIQERGRGYGRQRHEGGMGRSG
jgi:hypothetical protein